MMENGGLQLMKILKKEVGLILPLLQDLID